MPHTVVFERQRQSIQTNADFRNGVRIRRRHLEGREHGLCAIPEEGNDGVLE